MQHLPTPTMSQDDQKDAVNGSSPAAPPVLPMVDEDSVFSADTGATAYKYRDFSTVNEDDEDAVSTPDGPVPAPSRNTMETSIRVQKFPVKLYSILAQKEFNDIICWMPHGRSWKVLKPNVFESLVMPLFFEYSNYHSFNRLVNAWSFRRVSSGPDRGSYYHELFLRGKPHLQKYMRRLPKTHKKLPMRKQDEPDFYLLDKTNPLPSVEDAPIPGGIAVSQPMRGGQMPPQGGPGSMGLPGGMPGGPASMGLPPQQVPGGMPGRMMPPSSVSHAPQPRFSQGMYNGDSLQGPPQDDFGDLGSQGGERGMMSGRGLLQSNNGAFRAHMSGGAQGMPPRGPQTQSLGSQQAGMASQIPSGPNRMSSQMGGRGGMPNQMYPGGMPSQFMNQMQGSAGVRRFRPLPGMDPGMPGDQGMMPLPYAHDNMPQGQDDFYPQHPSAARQQSASMRRMQMDQMASMQQMYNDRAVAGMGQEQMPAPYGDMPATGGGNNYRDSMPAMGNDYMYRDSMPAMGGSEDFMGMMTPMRRSRN